MQMNYYIQSDIYKTDAINCLQPINGNPCNKCEICVGIQNQQILDVM
jgi:DNA polymerase III gamma/tau subunit